VRMSDTASTTPASTLRSMGKKDYKGGQSLERDWDMTLVGEVSAIVPSEMGGLRLDQALARLFHQYSRSRLQDWLRAGHVKVDGRQPAARAPVMGGETIVVAPPRLPDAAAPRAQK